MKNQFKIFKFQLFFLFFCFCFIGNQLKAQSSLTTIPYGIGKIVVDANSIAQYQNDSYLSVSAQHFVKPQYSGNLESDKHLFEVAVSTWIKQYPAEFKAFQNQQPATEVNIETK